MYHTVLKQCRLKCKMDSNFAQQRARAVLSPLDAREIFKKKPKHMQALSYGATELAAQYGVSSKAVRDIWCGRTWLDATYDVWDEDQRPPRRVKGRPKGAKDSKPRKLKTMVSSGKLSDRESGRMHRLPSSQKKNLSLKNDGQTQAVHRMINSRSALLESLSDESPNPLLASQPSLDSSMCEYVRNTPEPFMSEKDPQHPSLNAASATPYIPASGLSTEILASYAQFMQPLVPPPSSSPRPMSLFWQQSNPAHSTLRNLQLPLPLLES